MGVADDYTRFTLRIPPALHDTLLQRARDHQRSLNSEIITMLEDQTSRSEMRSRIDLEARFDTLKPDQKRIVTSLINVFLKT